MTYWKSFSDFLAMGGYALYVWGSYAVAAAVIGLELNALRRRRQRARAEGAQWRALHGSES